MLSILEMNSSVGFGLHTVGEKIVYINGNKGYFAKWVAPAKDQKGGELTWIKGNTLCKMKAFKLDEDEMIKYAKSIRSIE